MDTNGTLNAGFHIAPHQSPRQGIFFHDGNPPIQFGKNNTRRQTADTGADDQDILFSLPSLNHGRISTAVT
jgi:hypothetical protein